jgi:hypothetical protein
VARRRRGGRGRGGATAAASAVGAAASAAASAATPSPTNPTSTIDPQPTPRVLDSPLAGADPTTSSRLTSSVSRAPSVRTTEDAKLLQPPARLGGLDWIHRGVIASMFQLLGVGTYRPVCRGSCTSHPLELQGFSAACFGNLPVISIIRIPSIPGR